MLLASPFNVMEPVDEAHNEGFTEVPFDITGVRFTVTNVVAAGEGQFPVVAVIVTE